MKYSLKVLKEIIGSKLPPAVRIENRDVRGSLLPVLNPLKYVATKVAPTIFFFSLGSLTADELDPIKTANQVGADLSLIYNHDPRVEQENFELLDGFEVNLFAMEPMIENPVHMVWGPRGRLWKP